MKTLSCSLRQTLHSERFKRYIDVVGSVLGMVFFFPVLCMAASAIRLYDGGPIFYASERIGRHSRPFVMYKLRTMVVDAHMLRPRLERRDGVCNLLFKLRFDPRVTPVGRVLRRLSIDEIPQFWNVIRGEMSLVGPRPALASEVSRYSRRDRERLGVRPGMTCLWQVSGRSQLGFAQQSILDRQYIQSRSLWLDLWILARTLPAVVWGRGAY